MSNRRVFKHNKTQSLTALCEAISCDLVGSVTIFQSVVTPFVMTHPDVKPKLYDSVYNNNGTGIDWLGSIQPNMAAFWADLAVAMVRWYMSVPVLRWLNASVLQSS